MVKNTVLVTGASSGIGMDLAKVFAQNGYDLVLLARGFQALANLSKEIEATFGVIAHVVEADLSDPLSPANIIEELTRHDIQIDVLVNNAGFGLGGSHADIDCQRQIDMIQVNVTSLVHLTRLLLPAMISRNRGGVLNVASTAAFQAGPNMAIYFATKAFVLSYTEALHEELKGTQLKVSCLCPGPTHTRFEQAAGIQGVKFFKYGAQTSQEVAQIGYRAFQRGQAVAISGFKNWLLSVLGKFSPRFVTRKVTGSLNQFP